MPKFPKGFGRRKSTTNTLDEPANAPAVEPSFRVFERPNESGKSFDGGSKLAQSAARPIVSPRQKEDNMFEDLKVNRGSGASNSNTASTTDNSSRLSAASTAPSSTDFAGPQDKSSDRQYGNVPIPPIPKTSSTFSLKAAAGRTFSFGRTKPAAPFPKSEDDSPPPPPKELHRQEDRSRPRAVTASSYASTATPPRIDDQELSLGGDFADMFSGLGHRKSAIMENNRALSPSLDELRNGPAVPARTYAGSRRDAPPPLNIDHSKEAETSPYSWGSRNSQDRLLANSSPSLGLPARSHGSPLADRTANGVPQMRLQRVDTPTDGKLKRNSIPSGRRQPPLGQVEAEDEDARLLKESLSAAHLLEEPSNLRVRDSWMAPIKENGGRASPSFSGGASSIQSTPRALKIQTAVQDDVSSTGTAQRYIRNSHSPSPAERAPKNKVMTPAQFEKYRRETEALRILGGASKDEDNDDDDDAYDDDDDEAERQNQAAKQRLKQEAHMSVYRQQMMKVTGEAPAAANRFSTLQPLDNFSVQNPSVQNPSVQSSSVQDPSVQNSSVQNPVQNQKSAPAEDGDEDEDVPLAILAAHGFPNKNRPPTRLSTMNSNPNLRAASQAGAYPPPQQATWGAGSSRNSQLPVFARNLPPDPYVGASLVTSMNRESLSLGGGGAASNYGGSQRGVPPGGLIGVIASEERSRAMRRGSPKVGVDFGPSPNGFGGTGMPPMSAPPPMPQMPQAMMAGNMNGMGPMGPMPMGQMQMPMLTPGDHAQLEMAHQMQQFMQMQMQFMQMMSNQGRPQSQNSQAPFQQPMMRTDSPQPASQQRAMSMLNPSSVPWQQNAPGNIPTIPPIQVGGYAPSIAPSERSNVGLPGRYRPVSQVPVMDKHRSMTMSGALQEWGNTKESPVTVKLVKKSEDAEEDDEEGWEAMMQKREKKKSKWRLRKADSDSKEMLGFIA